MTQAQATALAKIQVKKATPKARPKAQAELQCAWCHVPAPDPRCLVSVFNIFQIRLCYVCSGVLYRMASLAADHFNTGNTGETRHG